MVNLLEIREKNNYELKEAAVGVPKSIYETLSSFANTNGGTIYLGIKENRPNNIIVGLTEKQIDSYIVDLLNTVQNKTKISYPVIDDDSFEKIELDNHKYVLSIKVKESPRNVKPVYLDNQIKLSYGRNGEGDYLLSNNQIKSFLNDNQEDYYDTLPNVLGFDFSNVNRKTLDNYRKELNLVFPNNINRDKDDFDFLKTIGAIVKDSNQKDVLTNAAVIMFTSYDCIIKIFPGYLLDYQRISANSLKWNNRIVSDEPTWSGNLFDFYELVFQDLLTDLPSGYVPNDGRNISYSLMVDCIKEALANAFSNHSFFLSLPLKIIRYDDKITLRNNGRMLVDKERAFIGGLSKPRNIGIISFFRKINVADRSGSGIPEMVNAMEQNHFPIPMLFEGVEPEETTTLVLSFEKVGDVDTSNTLVKKILSVVERNGKQGISITNLSNSIGVSRMTVSSIVNELIKKGLLIDNGKPTKGKLIFIQGLK